MEKRFLIVTASIGSGHEKAASAIAEGIRSEHPEARIDMVDFMRWDTSVVNALMKFFYLKMLALVPNLYEFMYQFTAGKRKGGFIQVLMAYAMARSIKQLIRQYDPQVIICTHPFPAEAVSHLSGRWHDRFIAGAAITDYSVHQMWICHNLDFYFVACASMKRQLIAAGIKAEIIHVTGIPVAAVFHQPYEKAFHRRKHGLRDDLPVVLMMGGGLGLGSMDNALEQLEKIPATWQLLVVAGKNVELKQQAEARMAVSHHHVTVYGYTEEIQSLMAAADVLVTKPGALTLTEAVSMHLPMVLHEPIPGPETDNARYMSGCGAAVWMHAGDNLAHVLRELLEDRQLLEAMAGAAKANARPETVGQILAAIEKTAARA